MERMGRAIRQLPGREGSGERSGSWANEWSEWDERHAR